LVVQAGAATLLTLSSGSVALANEFDLLSTPTPTKNYIIDDAGVLSRTTRKGLSEDLNKLEVLSETLRPYDRKIALG
jgi:uncharacterized membrane protein YgcG